MVGARQFTVQRAAGEETIVLIHHPLNWFKDNAEAARYFQSRVRVLISGHEHNPKAHVEPVEDGTDFMMLAAGATVPFKSNEQYTFTYNVIEFDWDSEKDALAVTIHPREWNPVRTCFEADHKRLGGKDPTFVLGSPNFRKGDPPDSPSPRVAPAEARAEEPEPIVEVVAALDTEGDPAVPPEDAGYRFVLLRFFRDLSEGDRLTILVELGAIEVGSDERITQAIERQLLDWLVREGRIAEVETIIERLITR